MIYYREGDLFDSPAQTLVNPVNTVGVMGKGLALSFKERYPDMFAKYKEACDRHLLVPGMLMICRVPHHLVLLFPTKEHWRDPSSLDYIEAGLSKFRETYAEKGITSIAFPKLGCGCGGLHWDIVRPVMEKYLVNLPIDVYIYR
jgi:O-acetyl-ADP-ribose deacetylase (regulator of RNase III)